MAQNINKLFINLIIVSIIVSCSNVKKVAFDTPIDTRSKIIVNQKKQTYELNGLGVFASNQFDSARLNGFERLNDSTVLVIINPENTPINNSAYYAFDIWADDMKELYLTFEYPNGFKHRYVPKIKKNNRWSVIDSAQVLRKDSIVTIKLNLDSVPIRVAAQEIHSSNDVRLWYEQLLLEKKPLVEKYIIGKSAQGRDMVVLDINKPSSAKKKLVILLTRQHPPEVTGYFAFQHFLNTLLENTTLSSNFLDSHRVLAFPLINPDGVDLGHWRHNARGVDLNRDWSAYRQPEIRSVVRYINKVKQEEKKEILIGLDFHSTWYDVFYTNKERQKTSLPNFIDKWFLALEQHIPGYRVNEKSSNSKQPVSKGWFLYGQNAVGITYEIGDETTKEKIEVIGSISATYMMKILLNQSN